jgi:hypothetical protein
MQPRHLLKQADSERSMTPCDFTNVLFMGAACQVNLLLVKTQTKQRSHSVNTGKDFQFSWIGLRANSQLLSEFDEE